MKNICRLDYSHKGKIDLVNAELYEEEGSHFLRLKYTIENDDEKFELEIPKARICLNNIPIINGYDIENSYSSYVGQHYELILGNNMYKLYPGTNSERVNNVCYTEKRISKKPKKMTVAEIEKKLGYKIEIVSEEGKEKRNE